MVVGSSAGGIEALSMLASTLPADFPSSIVIAQHLDPTHPSRLEEILSRYGALPVKTVDDEEALTAGTIFVVPSNRQIKINDHMVKVLPPDEPGPKPSVDRLFSSAAAWFKERLVAVVLSGTGSDGADGARVVHDVGGTVIIQNPETAAFSGMPRSLAPATVDLVADIEDIGGLLTQIVSGSIPVVSDPDQADESQDVEMILQHLRERRGVDFHGYRRPTILRRLKRRLLATHTSTFPEYLEYLRHHSEEEEQLVSSFLIKVTDFFRDTKTYDYLRQHVLPNLLAAFQDGRDGSGLRIWSAGCATGEEAYSLAILVSEALEQNGLSDRIDVRIFATDMEDGIVSFARRGVYPESALKNVPPEMVEKYFHEVNGEYEVDADIRSLIVFGPHDLIQMPPFPRMDLVFCRNVLMYFTPELQRRALRAFAFAFALRENGFLVLGSAETVRPLEGTFTVEESGLKIFRRSNQPAHIEPSHLGVTASRLPDRRLLEPRKVPRLSLDAVRQAARDADGLEGRFSEVTLLGLPIGIVIVNQRYDIRQINAAARALLGIHGLAAEEDLIHLLSNDVAEAFRAAIDTVFERNQPLRLEEIMAANKSGNPSQQYLQLVCAPWRPFNATDDGAFNEALLAVTDVTKLVRDRIAAEQDAREQKDQQRRLDDQITRMSESNRRLLKANEELAFAEETLRMTRDEYAAISADAQATTEELETYAEELQATSEELETLNEELRSTVEELTISNNDLDARAIELSEQRQASEQARQQLSVILSSMGDAVLVVDTDGKVIHTNAAYQAIAENPRIPYVPRDEEGHPIAEDMTPQARAAMSEAFSMQFTLDVEDGTRRWYEAIGQPIGQSISLHESRQSVVVIRDITDRNLRQAQEEFVARISHELRTPLTALHGYLQLLIRRLETRTDMPPEQIARSARSAFDQGQRLETLVSELMDFTRLRGGRLHLDLQPIDLVRLANRAVEVASAVSEGQTIVLETALDSLVANVDEERLEGVLYNLLTNAIKYAPDSDRIELRVRKVGDEGAIEVSDHGAGIPEEDLENIFGRFFQGEQPAGSHRSGLGLGLYIAREVVSMHRGRIEVASKDGRGTTFTVWLPLG